MEERVTLLLALAQAGGPAGDEIGSVNREIFQYFELVAILLGVVAFAFVALRYWLPRLAGVKAAASGPIRVVARFPLEPRRTIYIVKAGTEYLMLATSEAGVHFLASLDADRIQAALEDGGAQPRTESEFARLTRSLMRARGR